MKNYRVTDKHAVLKENITIFYGNGEYVVSYLTNKFSKDDIKKWIENSWIEEIQEPKFTRSEMIKFSKDISYDHPPSYIIYNLSNTDLDKWIEEQTV